MSTITPISPSPVTATPAPLGRVAVPPMFKNAAEWLHALGDVPLPRIVFDPWPGTATEEDMIRINESEERFVELIYSTLVEKVVGDYESFIAGLIITAINVFAVPRKLGFVNGEASMKRVPKGNIRMPDVCYTRLARVPDGKVTRDAISSLAPDLIVEVLSASNTKSEIALKIAEFFAAGTRLAWVVDPKKETAQVYHAPGAPDATLRDGDSLDGEDVLPGFSLSLHELFHTYD